MRIMGWLHREGPATSSHLIDRVVINFFSNHNRQKCARHHQSGIFGNKTTELILKILVDEDNPESLISTIYISAIYL